VTIDTSTQDSTVNIDHKTTNRTG